MWHFILNHSGLFGGNFLLPYCFGLALLGH
jgi:hypothetical protein